MENNRKLPGLLEKTAQIFELPGDIIAGLPRVELVGASELRVENHKGILSCDGDEIHISAGKYLLEISGEGLEIRAMTGLEILITGTVHSIVLT